VPALLRTKAELETRCQMLEAQLAKMQASARFRGMRRCQQLLFPPS
jgi:hypothetical protein